MWQNGGEIAEQDGEAWKSDMAQPEAVKAIDFLHQLYKQGYSPKAAITWEEPDARTAFINGKIAMMWAGPWDYDAIVTEKPGLEGKVGVTLVPAGPSGDRSAFAGGSHLVTFKESDNPDLASAFVDLLGVAVAALSLVVLIIPLFIVMRRSGLLGSYVGLIAAYLAFTVPLAVWILRGFIETIPVELEEAALVDGATRFSAMVRIVLLLALPGLATCATFSFINAWNEFMFALTFMNEESKETLPVVLQTFVGRGQTDWAAVVATSVIYTLPVVALFALLRRHLVTGLTSGALKG